MSSDTQHTLRQFADESGAEDADGYDERPTWSPGNFGSTNNECDGCGAHVTPQFRRAYEDDDGLLHGCPNCLTGAEIRKGLATDPDRDLSHEYEAGAYGCAINGDAL